MAYRGTEGTRPYAGAAWFYAEHRAAVSGQFVAAVIDRLGWSGADRVLDLGCGPGNVALRFAPHVREVVGVDPEPDMVAEAARRAAGNGIQNARFRRGSSDDIARW